MMGIPIPDRFSLQGSQGLSEERILPGPRLPALSMIAVPERSPDGMRVADAVGRRFPCGPREKENHGKDNQ